MKIVYFREKRKAGRKEGRRDKRKGGQEERKKEKKANNRNESYNG